ncbi:hypothetical protein COY59_02720 [Candidatus Gottesmanbacteria bacterium CG_4_10_14_0_8_um_filter_37_24]|uniref:Glycosyltransferase RgtA/B/C/D-like domain-containing protein n=2 Tax=Candidatus Gottesmaniibacteriota TaxID=1752720 RepID=A0A2M7RRL2_9BACT|nr:MAG: hypothetical protein AUJ73_00095 [Candidatus Gottesmanbacteria bacterium CG1_02_37_22]PIZ02850.1 MAG: hypothetical protein COY59_02720 [Candidatus Gottesmanbacteria bacterium CG_4_10_14_0_8_um_filter_37_24]
MKNVREVTKILIQEETIVTILTLLFILLSIYPTLRFYYNTPPDSVYSFLHNSVSDYPYYISFIRQGILGRFTTIDQFTSENQSAGFIHIFYLFLGRIGSLFGFSPFNIYFLARILLGILFLLTSYYFIAHFLDSKIKRLLAYVLFISSASFPQISFQEKGINISSYLSWWTEVDPIRRVTFIPHFLLGHTGMVLMLLLLLKLTKSGSRKLLLLCILTGNIIGISHPPSLGMVYFIFGFYLLTIFFIILLKKGDLLKVLKEISLSIKFYLLFVILTVPSLYYIYYTTGNIFPWTLMKAQESLFYYISLKEYMLSIGPILPMGLIGFFSVKIIIKDKTKLSNFNILILWIIIDLIMIPFSKIIAFSNLPIKIPTFANIRFLSMVIQLPLSILAVLFLLNIKKTFGSKFVCFSLFTYFITTLSVYPVNISSQINDFIYARKFVYPSKKLINVIKSFDSVTDESKAVLARQDTSLIISLFARNKVYFGQSVYTYDNENKSNQADKFFQGNMTSCEGEKFIREGRIDYVLTENKLDTQKTDNYPFLRKVEMSNKDESGNGENNIYLYEYDSEAVEGQCKGDIVLP